MNTTKKKNCQQNPPRVSKLLMPPQGVVTASLLYLCVFPSITKKVTFQAALNRLQHFNYARQTKIT